jgi:hypothetical protein
VTPSFVRCVAAELIAGNIPGRCVGRCRWAGPTKEGNLARRERTLARASAPVNDQRDAAEGRESSNTILFSLIGNIYGGDVTKNTFALPDPRSVAPNDLTYVICTEGLYPSRS